MDHNEAIRLQAAEKYALGELPGALREEFEEHFFDCAECAEDLKAVTVFADNARDVLRRTGKKTEKDRVAAAGGWFGWLKPIVAVPAFAVLLIVVLYQNTVTIPRVREEATSRAEQIVFSSYPLRGVNTAGDGGRTLAIRPGEAFVLNFDFVPTRSFDNYIGQLEDTLGRVLLKSKIAGKNANQEAHLPIAAGTLHPGKYVLAFYGDPGASGEVSPQNEAGRLPFVVEFRP